MWVRNGLAVRFDSQTLCNSAAAEVRGQGHRHPAEVKLAFMKGSQHIERRGKGGMWAGSQLTNSPLEIRGTRQGRVQLSLGL